MSEHCGWRGRFDWWPVDVFGFVLCTALLWHGDGADAAVIFAVGALVGYLAGRTAHD